LQKARQILQKELASGSFDSDAGAVGALSAAADTDDAAGSSSSSSSSAVVATQGGRRAGTQTRADDERRQESNRAYRRHRASELLRAAHKLTKFSERSASAGDRRGTDSGAGSTSASGGSGGGEAAAAAAAAAAVAAGKVPSDLLQLHRQISQMVSHTPAVSAPSSNKTTAAVAAASQRPNLLPFFLRLFSFTAPVVRPPTWRARCACGRV
jgi:hypothetical protein